MLSLCETRPDDAEAIVALPNPIIKAGCYTAFVTPFTVVAEREFTEKLPARGSFLGVFEARSERLGFQVVTPLSQLPAFDHVGEIGTYMRLESQRQGIAGLLYEKPLSSPKLRVTRNFWRG